MGRRLSEWRRRPAASSTIFRLAAGARSPFDEEAWAALGHAVAERPTRRTDALTASVANNSNHAKAQAASPDLTACDLARIDRPVLIIHGGGDPIFPPDHARWTAKAIASSRLLLIEHMGHALDPAFFAPVASALELFWLEAGNPSAENEVLATEVRFRGAMLSSDVEALDRLLDDDLLFTDQNGQRLTKATDLAPHRSGRLKLARLDVIDGLVRHLERTALVAITCDLAGTFDDERFSGLFCYTRTWSKASGDWRVVGAHCSAKAAPS